MDETPHTKSSLNLFMIVIGVLIASTVIVVFLYSSRKPRSQSSPFSVTPANISTAAGAAQSFTATYSKTDGWENISDASFYVSDDKHDQWLHYNPITKSFTLKEAAGSCAAGQAATLSTDYLTLNCAGSSASGPEPKATITVSLTPKHPFSGAQYRIFVFFTSRQQGSGNGTFVGTWTIKKND